MPGRASRGRRRPLHHRLDGRRGSLVVRDAVHVLDVDHPDDVVEVAPVDGEPREAGRHGQLGQLGDRLLAPMPTTARRGMSASAATFSANRIERGQQVEGVGAERALLPRAADEEVELLERAHRGSSCCGSMPSRRTMTLATPLKNRDDGPVTSTADAAAAARALRRARAGWATASDLGTSSPMTIWNNGGQQQRDGDRDAQRPSSPTMSPRSGSMQRRRWSARR